MTTCAMLDLWREQVTSEKAHFRKLSRLPGTRRTGKLAIEAHTDRIRASIEANLIVGVRSPPGSGKTMILPELLQEWAEELAWSRWEKRPAVIIAFPTKFGCLKIRDSLCEFRKHPWWTLNLRTSVDKHDRFHWGQTKFQVVTYGTLWAWLVKGGPETFRKLFKENCAFLLDEFSGKQQAVTRWSLPQIRRPWRSQDSWLALCGRILAHIARW